MLSFLRGDFKRGSGDVTFVDPDGPESSAPFAPHFDKYIRPKIEIFEDNRLEALTLMRQRTLKAIVGYGLFILSWPLWGTPSLAYLRANTTGDDPLGLFVGLYIIVLIGLAAWCGDPARKFKKSIKDQIFPKVFSFFGTDFHYSAENRLSIDGLEKFAIIPDHNRQKAEDYVKGTYKGVTLEMNEARLKKVTGSGKRRRTRTVFKGIFVLLSMNKTFTGKTIVMRDAGAVGNWMKNAFAGFASLETIRLEDPRFEKMFEVYGTDQVEARYLLTTSFMERLMALSTLFDNARLQCSFYEDQLLLMIPSRKDRFEPGSIFRPVTFVDDINMILQEMQLIFQIIDTLKLDQRTGL